MPNAAAPVTVPARERILASAYELFTRNGIRAVGIDEVIRRTDVAKATLYRHFPSKDALASTSGSAATTSRAARSSTCCWR